jgi:hypothetical protein
VTPDQRVPYMPPTADELRFLIKKYWLEHLDASKRENADDEEFLDLKVRASQRQMQDLIRSGLQPLEAESQAMREVPHARGGIARSVFFFMQRDFTHSLDDEAQQLMRAVLD